MGLVVQGGKILSSGGELFNISSAQTFDFYISTTGNDANVGSLASPWAITSLSLTTRNANNVANALSVSGKRVGIIAGSYDVSALMPVDVVVGALDFVGSSSPTSPTFIASCDANGHYSPRVATLDAKGSSGFYGGHVGGPGNEPPIVSHSGQYPRSYTVGNLKIDGLIFTGYSYKAVRVGGHSSGDGPAGITGVIIQNCEFKNGAANPGDGADNQTALWLDCTSGALVTNNYFHDFTGQTPNSGDHLNAIFLVGDFGSTTGQVITDTVVEYCTIKNSGNVYGKERNVQATTVRYCYLDVSMYTANSAGLQDCTGANGVGPSGTGLTGTTKFHNNVLLLYGGTSNNTGFGEPTLNFAYGWTTALQIYNNTVIITTGGSPVLAWLSATGTGNGQGKYWNNIYWNKSTSGSNWNNFGVFRLNPSGPTIMDYNLNYSPTLAVTWVLYQDASLTTAIGTYSSQSTFATALAANGGISNADAHDDTSGQPLFTGSGGFASYYTLTSGSPGKGTGSTDGTTGGSSCDMGAMGGIDVSTQIGASFAQAA